MTNKIVFVVEHGSHFSSDPWKIVGVFDDEQLADAYIESQGMFRGLYEKTAYEINKTTIW